VCQSNKKIWHKQDTQQTVKPLGTATTTVLRLCHSNIATTTWQCTNSFQKRCTEDEKIINFQEYFNAIAEFADDITTV